MTLQRLDDLFGELRASAVDLIEEQRRGVSHRAGALAAYLAVGFVPELRPYVLALSSASLMYIAMSDLIPDLHRGQLDSNSTRQVALIVAGAGTVLVLESLIG